MLILSLLSRAALLSTDERVHQKIAMSRDFGDAMQKLFVEPSKPDDTDRENAITSPNFLRPWEGTTRLLGLSQPPTGFKALDLADRLKRADSQLNDKITGLATKLFTGTSDEMQSVEGQDTFRSDNVDFGAFVQLNGNDDPLTNFDAASFESDDSEIESYTAGRASGFVLNSEPQVIEALNLATGSSFNLNSDTDQSASELLAPGSAVSELKPKTDASQPLLA